MNKVRRENVQHVNTGDPLSRAPAMEQWNSFSRPIKTEDIYSHSEDMIGEMNPALEKIEI